MEERGLGKEGKERVKEQGRARVHFHTGVGPRPMPGETQVPCQVGEESSSAVGCVLSEQISRE